MNGYITNLLLKYGHKAPAKPQLSLYRHSEINYVSKEQLVEEEDTSPKLNNGPPQAGKLANHLLRTRLNDNGNYETTPTPGLWRHEWRPIMFVLIVDDFGIEYVGNHHFHHLRTFLATHYTITEDLEGKFFLA